MISLVRKPSWARWAWMFVLGAVFGTLYDYVHVYYGVLTYARPDFAGTSLWFVPAEFGISTIGGGIAFRRLAREFDPPLTSPSRALLDAGLLLLAYLFTGWFAGNHLMTLLALLPLVLISVLSRPGRFVIVASAIAAAVGPFFETCISLTGVFHYNYVMSVVPFWLPLLWVVAAGMFIDFALLVLEY